MKTILAQFMMSSFRYVRGCNNSIPPLKMRMAVVFAKESSQIFFKNFYIKVHGRKLNLRNKHEKNFPFNLT